MESHNYFHNRLSEIGGEALWNYLPEKIQNIPIQVTARTGIKIEVLPIADCSSPLFGLEKAGAALDIDGISQRIIIWYNPEAFDSSILAHELIHLRRDIIEQQPKIMPFRCSPGRSSTLFLVENELEHLLIIPEEITLFAEAELRWVEHYNVLIDTITKREQQDILENIFTWMQIRSSLPNQTDLAKRFAAHLNKLGPEWVKTCDYIRHIAMQALPNKSKLISIITKELNDMSPDLGQSIAIGHWEMSDDELNFSIKMVGGQRLS